MHWNIRRDVIVLGMMGCMIFVPEMKAQDSGAKVGAAAVPAATPESTKSDAELDKEDHQGEDLFAKQDFIDAMPLYMDLEKRRPQMPVYKERLAMCLLAKRSSTSDDVLRKAFRARAVALLQEAHELGDDSNLYKVLMEELAGDDSQQADKPKSPAEQLVQQAEGYFGRGDLPHALEYYKKAAETDPKLYSAPLFAGDTCYKMHDYAEANKWFARAVAIDPNIETAHRYWGDNLMAAGEMQAARDQFVAAIVASPYAKAPWVGLQQWAERNNVHLAGPVLNLPPGPKVDSSKPNQTNITLFMDPSKANDPNANIWLGYSIIRGAGAIEQFKKNYPDEKEYRHNLKEEMTALSVAISSAEKIPEKKRDATTNNLLALNKDGMLESWLLISHADQGLAQDYVAYREKHRDLLQGYIVKYIVHQ